MNMSSPRHAVLMTGANRGIGFAIVHSLAMALPSSTLLLGCRDTGSGEAAVSDLRSEGISWAVVPVQLDVSNDDSVQAAVGAVAGRYGKLDVLVSNAGYAAVPPDAGADARGYRAAFQSVYDVNVASVALCMALFLPLLRKTRDGRIVNVSSARASMRILAAGEMPPTVSIPYSLSKVALNALTMEMSRYEENGGVVFLVVGPGHCKTASNGYRGLRDPMEGAVVVVECVMRSREEVGNAAFWETKV